MYIITHIHMHTLIEDIEDARQLPGIRERLDQFDQRPRRLDQFLCSCFGFPSGIIR